MYNIYSNRGRLAYGVVEYTLDTEADLTKLPKTITPGSTAFVIEKSQYYKLNSKRQWVKVKITNRDKDGRVDFVEPILANNSWETIQWVAQNDDPSNYWKIGDYKMLKFPAFTRGDYLTYRQYSSNSATTYTWATPELTRTDSGAAGAYMQGTFEIVDIPKFISKVKSLNMKGIHKVDESKYNSIEVFFQCNGEADGTGDTKRIIIQARPVKSNAGTTVIVNGFKTMDYANTKSNQTAIEYLLQEYGVKIVLKDDYDNQGYRIRYAFPTICLGTESIPEREYPIVLIDTNKDIATSVDEYGKPKVGATFCLGASRSCALASPPYNYIESTPNNLYDLCFFVDKDGKVQQFPYISDDGKKIMSPYSYCNTTVVDATTTSFQTQVWSETKFRECLQQLFDATEISDYIVPVEKSTAYKLFRPNYNYLPTEGTNDKVFLPSEYELNGQRFYYTGSYLDKDTEPSSSITCGIGEEGQTYEFFNKGYSRFFWNKEFLTNLSIKEINVFTRSKPRQSTDKAIEASSECCYLKCKGNSFKLSNLKQVNNNTIYENTQDYSAAKYDNYQTKNLSVIEATSFKLVDFDKFLQYYGKYGNGEYSVTVKYEADEHELFFRLKLDGVQVDLDSCETWRSDAQDYWFGKSFLLDSYTFGGYIPQPTQETIIATFTVNGIKTATNIIDPGTTITIDSDITPLIEKLKQNNSTLEPLGTYEFKITSGEEISGYGVIKIMKDGHNLEGGDGIINYPVFHLNNPEEGFVINGKFEATGSVSYAPSAGDVEGYILPMFCM